MTEKITYWNYLELENLLSLQAGIEKDGDVKDGDELHFIIIHQVYELWFKLLINELALFRDKMDSEHIDEKVIPELVHHLKRCNEILHLSSEQYKLMETLIPQDFMKFRAKLGTASGFQSFQGRELEILLGLSISERELYGNKEPLKYVLDTSKNTSYSNLIKNRIEKRLKEKSVLDVVLEWLFRTPIHGSSPNQQNDDKVVKEYIQNHLETMKQLNEIQIQSLIVDGGDEKSIRNNFDTIVNNAESFLFANNINEDKEKISRIRAGLLFIESYRDLPLLSWPRLLIDEILELEERYIKFRFNHVRMVERVIGRRIGTGGSSGVDYLDSTTKYRIFKDIWAIRTIVLAKNSLPDLEKPDFYDFMTK